MSLAPACVRIHAQRQDQIGIPFVPNVGDDVEVMIEASNRNPPGWCAVRVTKIDGENFTVQLTGKDTAPETTVHHNALRRIADTRPFAVAAIERHEYEVCSMF